MLLLLLLLLLLLYVKLLLLLLLLLYVKLLLLLLYKLGLSQKGTLACTARTVEGIGMSLNITRDMKKRMSEREKDL